MMVSDSDCGFCVSVTVATAPPPLVPVQGGTTSASHTAPVPATGSQLALPGSSDNASAAAAPMSSVRLKAAASPTAAQQIAHQTVHQRRGRENSRLVTLGLVCAVWCLLLLVCVAFWVSAGDSPARVVRSFRLFSVFGSSRMPPSGLG
jgi:hypothetical protein